MTKLRRQGRQSASSASSWCYFGKQRCRQGRAHFVVKLIPNLVGMSVIPRLRHLFLALKAAMSLCRASKSAFFFTCPPPQAGRSDGGLGLIPEGGVPLAGRPVGRLFE